MNKKASRVSSTTTAGDMTTRGQEAKGGIPRWIDWILLLVVVIVAVVAVGLTWQSGAFGLPLTTDDRLSWHLVRAAGLTAYGLLAASTLWGLFLSSRVIKDWSPGPMSLLFHASTSWLAVILSFTHAGLLMFDKYYSYKIADLLIPFSGPYRTLAVGLGATAAWLVLAITISFSLRKLIGQRTWRLLHYTSYITFALVTVHALMAGTDADKLGMKILMGLFAIAVSVLLAWKLKQSMRPKPQGARRAVRSAE